MCRCADGGLGGAVIRSDFPGGWKNDSQNAFNPDTQTKEQKEFYDFTQKILNWRKNNEVIHTGKTTHYLPENGVYVYFRFNEKGSVMVVLNNNEKEQTLQLKRFEENLKSYTKGKDIISGDEIPLSETLTIPAKSPLILELK